MFSVVIPLYNKELSVKNTIDSVLNQSFQDFEIVIVNDGCTDNSVKVVEQFKDSRIHLIHQKNQGVSAARNRGIKEAKYEWLAFLDADDLWRDNHLEEFKNMISTFPENKVFTTSHTKSKLIKPYKMKMESGYEVIENYFDVVMNHVDFIWTGAVCIHKTVFDKVGGFPIGINRGEDLYLWAKIGKKFPIIRSLNGTVKYRLDSENKLTESRSVYENSIVSIITLKGVQGSELTYYKLLLINRLKRHIKQKDIVGVFKILYRYNYRLL